MGSFSKTQLDSDFAGLLADFDDGGTLNIGSDLDVTYNRISQSISRTEYLRNRYGDDYALTLAVQASALTSRPAHGSTVTFNSTTYRIMSIDDTPDTVAIHLHLGTEFTKRRG